MALISDDIVLISRAIARIDEARKQGLKAKEEIHISCGKASIYNMGPNNPVVRVDIKMEDKNG